VKINYALRESLGRGAMPCALTLFSRLCLFFFVVWGYGDSPVFFWVLFFAFAFSAFVFFNPEHYQYDLNLLDIVEVWRRGSVVSSWLLDLTVIALLEQPDCVT